MSASTAPKAEHDCGLCDAPLIFDGMSVEFETWICSDPECGWWHISVDCCMGHAATEGE